MPKIYDQKKAEAAVELARLVLSQHRGKTRQLLDILADQLEAASRLIKVSVERTRERELSQVLNLLEVVDDELSEEVPTGEIVIGRPVG